MSLFTQSWTLHIAVCAKIDNKCSPLILLEINAIIFTYSHYIFTCIHFLNYFLRLAHATTVARLDEEISCVAVAMFGLQLGGKIAFSNNNSRWINLDNNNINSPYNSRDCGDEEASGPFTMFDWKSNKNNLVETETVFSERFLHNYTINYISHVFLLYEIIL